MGYAKALCEKETMIKEREDEYLQIIAEQTNHVNNLLDELLTYTRFQNQSYQLKLENEDMGEVLRTCIAAYYQEFERHKMILEPEIPQEDIIFSFDSIEMKRVFINLIQNMLKHNQEGTICKIQLRKKASEHNQFRLLQIIFADNGAKVEKALCENMFLPFVVSDKSRNTKNGSGLGLSISKMVVERHGGIIYYEGNWEENYKAFVIEFMESGI